MRSAIETKLPLSRNCVTESDWRDGSALKSGFLRSRSPCSRADEDLEQHHSMLTALKQIVPRALWVCGRRAANYVRRLRNWRAVVREVHGVTFEDAAVIQRSVRAGVRGAASISTAGAIRYSSPMRHGPLDGIGEFAICGQSDELFPIPPSPTCGGAPPSAPIPQDWVNVYRCRVPTSASSRFLAARLVGPSGRVIAIR